MAVASPCLILTILKYQIALLKHCLYCLGDLVQALLIRSCHEDVILTRKSHNCAETAFVQGHFAGGSKLIEQTLLVSFSSWSAGGKAPGSSKESASYRPKTDQKHVDGYAFFMCIAGQSHKQI